MSRSPREVTVIGAGIIGISCARWLQKDGHIVRVVDLQPPGQGCSFGNAGIIASDLVVPLATMDTLRAIPGMLLNPDAGVVLRWSHLPRLLPWLVRFLASARPRRVEEISHALVALGQQVDASYHQLLAGSRAAELVRRTGWVTAFESQKAFDSARWTIEERQKHGIPYEMVDGAQLRSLVPELAPHVKGGAHSPNVSMCLDPAGFVERLADDVRANGGTIEQVAVQRVCPQGERIRLETAGGAQVVDHVVIAAGIDSAALARNLGDRFPLDTERGYHAMIAEPGMLPTKPVISGEYKYVATPMQAGLRLAGTTELGGMHRPPDYSRVQVILRHAQRLFPDLQTPEWSEWMGFRSTLPDSLPVIGRSPRNPAVSYAFGHQHIGLTLGALTGQLIADDLAGRDPIVDLQPVSPSRF